MARIAYYRVSTKEQTVESQRTAMGGTFDEEFQDNGVSGAVIAADRPGFAELLKYVRKGDTVHVYAVDRLGRDAIDVQQTVRTLIERGVSVDVHGLGVIAKGVGELILAVLAQIAAMERQRLIERCEAGRTTAKEMLATTGKTQNGATSMGRPSVQDAQTVKEWRTANSASISQTAAHFGIGTATVSRYCSQ